MKRILVLATGAALGLGISDAMAASDSAQVSAGLEVQGECEVIATGISANTKNFIERGSAVELDQGSDTLDIANFDNHPTGMSLNPASTVAVLCSAAGGDHTLTLKASGEKLSDGESGELAWAPVYAGVSQPGTTAPIAVGDGTDVTLTSSGTAATLHQYIITATVAADDIAQVNPGVYNGSVDLTVSYGGSGK